MVKESVSRLETEFSQGNYKRPKIGAAEETQLEQSSRNVQGADMQEIERDGEVDEWVPPSNQKGDGRTDLNSKFGY